MRSWLGVGILLSTFGAAPLFGGPRPEIPNGPALPEAPAPDLRLRLVWVDVGDIASTVFADAACELDSLFGEASIAIDWQHVDAGEGTDSVDLHVIVLETAPGVSRRVMGAARH